MRTTSFSPEAPFPAVLSGIPVDAAPSAPWVESIGPARIRVTEAEPCGVVAIIALPATRIDHFAGHLATALATGNRVIVAPLTRAQDEVARRLATTVPGAVRIAGEMPSQLRPAVDLLVILERDRFRVENGAVHDETCGADGATLLGEIYTRRRSHVIRGRSNLRGTRHAA